MPSWRELFGGSEEELKRKYPWTRLEGERREKAMAGAHRRRRDSVRLGLTAHHTGESNRDASVMKPDLVGSYGEWGMSQLFGLPDPVDSLSWGVADVGPYWVRSTDVVTNGMLNRRHETDPGVWLHPLVMGDLVFLRGWLWGHELEGKRGRYLPKGEYKDEAWIIDHKLLSSQWSVPRPNRLGWTDEGWRTAAYWTEDADGEVEEVVQERPYGQITLW